MEPLTHFLTGACIGRAGLNRRTAYATLAAVLAAEAADLDVVWSLAGPVEGLKHHRGITHTFLAVPVVAGAVVGAVWLLDRGLRARRRRKATPLAEGGNQPLVARERQAVHWGWLYGTALIAALSHLLLDWTNNYGVRPFFPFNPRWYEGSIVFIAEPVLWGLLLAALAIPGLLGLADREIGARRTRFRGRGWAIFALAGMAVLWCWRWTEHARGISLVENAQVTSAPVRRIALEPYPVNPFRWHAIVETDEYFQTAEVNTHTGQVDSDPGTDVIYKPPDTAAVEAAKRTPLGQVYLDWSAWPLIADAGKQAVPGLAPPNLPPGRAWTTINFTDLRFDYSFIGGGKPPGRSPLGASVYIVDDRDDAGEVMNGREQK